MLDPRIIAKFMESTKEELEADSLRNVANNATFPNCPPVNNTTLAYAQAAIREKSRQGTS